MNISLSYNLVDMSVWWTYLSFIPFLYFCPSGPRIPVCPPSLSSHSMPNGAGELACLLILSVLFSLSPPPPLLFILINLPIRAVDTCFYYFFFP